MNKLLTYGLLLLAVIYGVGYYNLNQSGVNRLLDKMQSLSMEGEPDELCDFFTNDAKVAIADHTVELDRRLGNGKVDGGKTEMCAYLRNTVKKIPAAARGAMSIQTQREEMTLNRNWLHPWTVDAAYNEKQTLTVQGNGRSAAIKTESDDKLQLVMTFAGVKIKRLESESWLR